MRVIGAILAGGLVGVGLMLLAYGIFSSDVHEGMTRWVDSLDRELAP